MLENKYPNDLNNISLVYPVKEFSIIDAPANEVWRAITTPSGLLNYHPFVKENPAQSWNAEYGRDTIVYHNNMVLEREIYAWQEGQGFDLKIGPTLEKITAVVHWRVIPIDDNKTKLSIEIEAVKKQSETRFMWWIKSLFMKHQLSRYLRSVVDGANYFITTGNKVSKNQFGVVKRFTTA